MTLFKVLDFLLAQSICYKCNYYVQYVMYSNYGMGLKCLHIIQVHVDMR